MTIGLGVKKTEKLLHQDKDFLKRVEIMEMNLREKSRRNTLLQLPDPIFALRTNLVGREPAQMWEFYTQLVQVEEAFKNLKGDLAIRPIFHQKEKRIEAHIFVAFLAYALHVTLRRRLRNLAPGLTPRSVLEKFSAVQMIDVHLPTTDGRKVILTRYTQPEPELQILLQQLRLSFPNQPPPRVTAKGVVTQ
jgi:transposase